MNLVLRYYHSRRQQRLVGKNSYTRVSLSASSGPWRNTHSRHRRRQCLVISFVKDARDILIRLRPGESLSLPWINVCDQNVVMEPTISKVFLMADDGHSIYEEGFAASPARPLSYCLSLIKRSLCCPPLFPISQQKTERIQENLVHDE